MGWGVGEGKGLVTASGVADGREGRRTTERDGGEVNIRDLIKQPRKNKVFDYKSLIYET